MLISKLDAARRQIDAAIGMYFNGGDPVAIHTLIAAGYEVVTALRTRAGEPDEILEVIVPDRRQEFLRLWRGAQNFLKHADRDPTATMELNQAQTELMLFLAAQRYGEIDRKSVPMTTMLAWYSMQNPDVLLDTPMKRQLLGITARMMPKPRAQFWAEMATAATEMGYH